MLTVLVTGGAGYIGSHACKALALAGHKPIVYDNLAYGHPWAAKWGPLELGDIADRHGLDAVIAQYQPQAVMHFAAYAYVGESVTNPGKYYRNNVAGALNLLKPHATMGLADLFFPALARYTASPSNYPSMKAAHNYRSIPMAPQR